SRCEELVAAAVARWRDPVAARGGTITVDLDPTLTDRRLAADPVAVSRALDNLFLNALVHGGPQLTLTASHSRTGIELALADRRGPGPSRRTQQASTIGASGLHGLGLTIVEDIVGGCGGRFQREIGRDGSVARLM